MTEYVSFRAQFIGEDPHKDEDFGEGYSEERPVGKVGHDDYYVMTKPNFDTMMEKDLPFVPAWIVFIPNLSVRGIAVQLHATRIESISDNRVLSEKNAARFAQWAEPTTGVVSRLRQRLLSS